MVSYKYVRNYGNLFELNTKIVHVYDNEEMRILYYSLDKNDEFLLSLRKREINVYV